LKGNIPARGLPRGRRLRFLLPWFLPTILAAGCDDLPGRPTPADTPVPPNKITSFEVLYTGHCAGCHGADGRLGPAPPLDDPLFLAIVPDNVLQNVIRQGRPHTLMPGFARQHGGKLTEDQVAVLARGIKSRWQSNMATPENIPSYLPPKKPDAAGSAGNGNGPSGSDKAGSDDSGSDDSANGDGASGNRQSAERGADVFARACAGCHGPEGRGGKDAGVVNSPALLQLLSDQALRRLVITGRPDLGMPNYGEYQGRPADFQPLTERDVADLVSLLASWRSQGNSSEAPSATASPASPSTESPSTETQ
jgi:cytochrome c oxidase cbb3-type subunit 3